MGGLSLFHWLVFGVIAILVLGGGRFSNMMGDVAKGIKNFKKGMADEEAPPPPARLEGQRVTDPQVEREAERARDDR